MTSTTSTSTTARSLKPAVVTGVVGGVIASMAMAMYAMIAAATYQGSGFFTPLYHIASLFIAPDKMMSSMQAAMGGTNFTFYFGAAVLGAMIHMMTGAMYGVGFGLIAAFAKLRGAALVGVGALWGALVFVMSAFVGLPLAAKVLDSGDQIADMADLVGYGTFFVEHLIFGMMLGVWFAYRSAKSA